MANNTFSDTLLVGFFPLFLQIANVQSWFVIIASGVTTIWVVYQLISKIREDLNQRKEKKRRNCNSLSIFNQPKTRRLVWN